MPESIWIELIRFAAVVSGVVIPAVLALHFTKWHSKQTRYRRQLRIALLDLEFMQAVENEHVKHNMEMHGQSYRRIMRQLAHKNSRWSGRFTPSGIREELARIEADEEQTGRIVSFTGLSKGLSK